MKRLSSRIASLVVAPLLVASSALSAQTVVVNGTNTTFTNPGTSNLDDPSCAMAADTWCARNVRNNGQAGITTTYAQSGNGSLELDGPGGFAPGLSYKSDFEYYLSSANRFALSALTSVGYDWFRASSSTASAHFAPALRLILSDFSYLVYEPTLNGTPPNSIFPQPTDAWQSTGIGSGGFFWWSKEGTQVAVSLADWVTGRTIAGVGTVNGDTQVIGFSVGIGSGWDGSFSGAVDNVNYKLSGWNEAKNFNFEVATSTVPEPSTYVLMAAGLAGLVAVRRRRARSA